MKFTILSLVLVLLVGCVDDNTHVTRVIATYTAEGADVNIRKCFTNAQDAAKFILTLPAGATIYTDSWWEKR